MLTGAQVSMLVDALGSAFTLDELRMMLRFRLDRDMDDVSAPASRKDVRIFELVEASERQGWDGQLIAAAREANPGNPELAMVAGEFGLTSTGKPSDTLERLVRDHTPFNDIGPWLEKWGRLETQVCRIEVFKQQGVSYGTGFLVGPDVVLTNHHVMEPVISEQVGPNRVLCRFDYKRLEDGMTLNPGTELRLDADGHWLLDHSPPSPADEQANGGLPQEDQLDYALVRLKDRAGERAIGASPEPDAANRGWIELPHSPTAVKKPDVLFLLQHPDKEPLKQASGAVLEVNENNTRVRHDVNTLGGSSGSPVFGNDLSLVALHQAGDPNFDKLYHPEYNQAIPMTKISAQLKARQIDPLA